MKTFNQFMSEMAFNIGSPYSMINTRPGHSKEQFDHTKSYPIIRELSPGIKLHKNINDNRTEFAVNDHNKGEILYNSIVIKRKPDNSIPFEHLEQNFVDRTKSTDVLPKNFATDFIYNHWKSQHLPLRSSDIQYTTGRDMWSRLVDKAHKDGKRVFYIEHGSHKLVTPENKDEMMNRYFGTSFAHENRHLVLSHTNELPRD